MAKLYDEHLMKVRPNVIYDIGATTNEGNWSKMAKTLTPNVFAFVVEETNPTHIQALKAARIPFYIDGVLSSPKKKKVKFHYTIQQAMIPITQREE